ncbi:Venom serine carboxypeptidase, partial [Orchesella cincta]
ANGQLLLSPYIESGLIKEARDASRVTNLSTNFEIEAYSGFITVNEEFSSNIFFWYFPPIGSEDASNAPVILWLQGGPGLSVQSQIFLANGPFIIQDDFTLLLRNESWVSTYHLIYIDSPAGIGFSYLHNAKHHEEGCADPESIYNATGYDSSANETAEATYTFLSQFFKMFPNLISNSFYIGGLSYAGHFVPALAYKIHKENKMQESDFRLNLRGLILESPFIEARTQLPVLGEYLHCHGVIDEISKAHIDSEMGELVSMIGEERFEDAHQILMPLFMSGNSFINNQTAFEYTTVYNHYDDLLPADYYLYKDFLQLKTTKEAIHVGNLTFCDENDEIYRRFAGDILVSYRRLLETLLDAEEGYRIVIYVGQLDIMTTFLGIENMIRSMNWSGSEEFFSGSVRKRPWILNNEHGINYCAGYVKTLNNFSYVLVRNAGHLISKDRTAWTLDLINRITKNIPFEQVPE